jgi:hypothetical protein
MHGMNNIKDNQNVVNEYIFKKFRRPQNCYIANNGPKLVTLEILLCCA